MKKTKIEHTPGPWRIKSCNDLVDVWGEVDHVCDVDGATALAATNRANAKLIAAAPDLLAACLAVRDAWRDNRTVPTELVNDAIAKATATNPRLKRAGFDEHLLKYWPANVPKECTRLKNDQDCLERGLKRQCASCREYVSFSNIYEHLPTT